MPLKPPAVCGRAPLIKLPDVRCDEFGRMEPAALRAFPVDSELPACPLLNTPRCCSGREKPWPSWRVTTRIPGFGVMTTGAWVRASEAAAKVVRGRKQASKRHGGCKIPIVLSFDGVGVAVPEVLPCTFSSLSVIVEVEGDLENVLVRGPRWVSLSSKAASSSATSHHVDARRTTTPRCSKANMQTWRLPPLSKQPARVSASRHRQDRAYFWSVSTTFFGGRTRSGRRVADA
jgi:hypothetical protein